MNAAERLPSQPTGGRRLGRAALLVAVYGWAGPLVGGLLFIVAEAVQLSIDGAHESYPGNDAVAMIFSTPIILIGASVVATLPAAMTGAMLGLELAIRGRASWLTALLAPLAAMFINDRLFLKSPVSWDFLVVAVASSLILRLAMRTVVDAPDTRAPAGWSELARSAQRVLARLTASRRARIMLVYVLAVPPLAALIFVVLGSPWAGPFSEVEFPGPYLVGSVLGIFSSALLALLTRDGRPISLVHAAWTPIPVWLVVVLGSREAIALGLFAAYVAANLIVTQAARRRL